MKKFASLSAFATHLAILEASMALQLEGGLTEAAKVVQETAQAKFGEYQAAVNNFSAWAELAEATKTDWVRQGFSADEPLLRTGELRDSISYAVKGLTAVIGSTNDVMVFHELGTINMPPRPVLGPAAVECSPQVQEILFAVFANTTY
jgi:HK97 gp10 family phage protein